MNDLTERLARRAQSSPIVLFLLDMTYVIALLGIPITILLVLLFMVCDSVKSVFVGQLALLLACLTWLLIRVQEIRARHAELVAEARAASDKR